MSNRRLLILVAAAAMLTVIPGLLVACGGSPEPGDQAAGEAQKVTLQLNWFHEAEFVGYYVAEAKGFYTGKGLDVTILEGGPGDPAIDHVVDGTAEFAVSSFGEQKEAIAEQRRLVAVMAAFQIPPLVIFSLSESGIREPADLAGRRVGVTTDYWKDVLDETLKAAGVDAARVRSVEVDAEDLQPLYDHSVDAWLGYAQDEPIQAEMDGHDVTNIFPADYGVGGYEGLVLAHERTVASDPELVRGFVAASQQGWRYAVEHPDEAAQVLLEWAPDPGLEFQTSAVRAVAPLVDIPQVPIGWIDDGRWRRLMGSAYDSSNAGYTMDFSASER
jgi:ABC-type nitrate/sulfonate/bicarbonate transport system substrate-binding protein